MRVHPLSLKVMEGRVRVASAGDSMEDVDDVIKSKHSTYPLIYEGGATL